MNDDAQAQLDAADMMFNDPDPAVRWAYYEAYGATVNPTDWAKIEDGYGGDYGPRPANRKRTAMPADPNDFLMGGGHVHEEDPDPDDGAPFVTAKYDGRCSACGEFHILAGDTLIRADGDGGWEAEECAW